MIIHLNMLPLLEPSKKSTDKQCLCYLEQYTRGQPRILIQSCYNDWKNTGNESCCSLYGAGYEVANNEGRWHQCSTVFFHLFKALLQCPGRFTAYGGDRWSLPLIMKKLHIALWAVLWHNSTQNLAKVCIFMQGPHFFKYAALSPHKLPISTQNMQGLHDFIIPAFSLQKKVTYILAESWKFFSLLHTRAISPCCHGNVMNWCNYESLTSSKSCIFRKFPHFFASSRNFLASRIFGRNNHKKTPHFLEGLDRDRYNSCRLCTIQQKTSYHL